MTTFTARLAGIATLALAVLPAAALTTAARSAPYVPTTVQIADLNLASADGQATFHARTEAAAHRFCRGVTSLSARDACRVGVRAEVNEKVASEIRLASRN